MFQAASRSIRSADFVETFIINRGRRNGQRLDHAECVHSAGTRNILWWPAVRSAERREGATLRYNTTMARWPRHVWTSIFTYASVFILFPLLCLLAYAWVKGWIF
jgi:hypothetical protein